MRAARLPALRDYAERVLPPLFRSDVRTETIAIVPLGRVNAREIEVVRRALVRTFDLEVIVVPRRPLPQETYYPPRHRYRAEHLDTWLARGGPGFKVLGVTDVDISTTTPGHRDWGVAGRALLGGRAAVVSNFRAKDRLGDVAVHEVGHTLGLSHCPHAGCVMRDAKGRIARIGTRFCPTCRAQIAPWLR